MRVQVNKKQTKTAKQCKITELYKLRINFVKRQNIDFIASAPTPTSYAVLQNCRMYNNLVTGSGTGFKAFNHTTNAEWCSFYGAGATNVPYIDCTMDNNYFWGLKRHIMKAVPTSVKNYNGFKWENNVIIHPKDEGSIGTLGEELDPPNGNKHYYYTEETLKTMLDAGARQPPLHNIFKIS